MLYLLGKDTSAFLALTTAMLLSAPIAWVLWRVASPVPGQGDPSSYARRYARWVIAFGTIDPLTHFFLRVDFVRLILGGIGVIICGTLVYAVAYLYAAARQKKSSVREHNLRGQRALMLRTLGSMITSRKSCVQETSIVQFGFAPMRPLKAIQR